MKTLPSALAIAACLIAGGGRPAAARELPVPEWRAARAGSSAIRTRSSRGLPSTPPPSSRAAAGRVAWTSRSADARRRSVSVVAAEQLAARPQRRGWAFRFAEIVCRPARSRSNGRSPRGQRAALRRCGSRESRQRTVRSRQISSAGLPYLMLEVPRCPTAHSIQFTCATRQIMRRNGRAGTGA